MKENQKEKGHLVFMIGMNLDMDYTYYIMVDVIFIILLDVFSSNDN